MLILHLCMANYGCLWHPFFVVYYCYCSNPWRILQILFNDSFKAGKWYEYTVNVLGMFAGAGPALTWASTHKQHYAYSDTELDPNIV